MNRNSDLVLGFLVVGLALAFAEVVPIRECSYSDREYRGIFLPVPHRNRTNRRFSGLKFSATSRSAVETKCERGERSRLAALLLNAKTTRQVEVAVLGLLYCCN